MHFSIVEFGMDFSVHTGKMCVVMLNWLLCFCVIAFLLYSINCIKESTHGKYWIGLRAVSDNPYFAWVTGENVTYTKWGHSQPNRHNLDACVNVNSDHHYKWYDDECTISLHFVCEHVLNTVPTTITAVTTSTTSIRTTPRKLSGKCQKQRYV